jgi:hypothetical protein
MSEVKLRLTDREQRQLEELRQRWRAQSPEEVIRDLISLGYLAVQKARRHALAGPEAAGPAEHQPQLGGETDAPSTQ